MAVLSRLGTLWSLVRQRRLRLYLQTRRLTRRYVDEWTNFPAIDLRLGGRVKIAKAPTARLNIRGKLVIRPWVNAEAPALIELLDGARMDLKGHWSMKDDSRIKVFEGGHLEIEGIRDRRQASSMLGSRSQIHVAKHVRIGANCAISWDVFITDSNWHALDGTTVKVKPTTIGDHCWIAARVAILPGARIGDDCVVATGSVVLEGDYPPRSLIAGSPARVIRTLDQPWRL